MSSKHSSQIDLAACRARQQRLLAVMERHQLDLAIVTQIEHVQYLAGPRFRSVFAPAAALDRKGRLTLIAPAGAPPDEAAADMVVLYEGQKHCTLRNDQRQASSEVLWQALGPGPAPRRIGAEFSSCGRHVSGSRQAEWIDIEPDLYVMRRKKDPDELALLRRAIEGTAAMHRRARQIVRPGISELKVFNELQAAAVESYGEMLTGTGNDYASGVAGGPPRDRPIEAGELYILDLGPAYRGYFADNTRTYAVDGQPTAVQTQAWRKVVSVFPLVEKFVRPGASCRELFQLVDRHLNDGSPGKFDHHLGHGIGLYPHEAPHLNPFWDDVFQEGEVFAVEPGVYAPELRGGIRLENNYLVTSSGVELLTPFPLEL